MDEQMNNNGYQYQPNPSPMPNPNKDGIAIAVLVLGIVSICFCCVAWGVISLACAIVSLVLYSRNKTMFSPQKRAWQQQDLLHRLLVVYLVQLYLQFAWLHFVQQHPRTLTLHIRCFCRIENM